MGKYAIKERWGGSDEAVMRGRDLGYFVAKSLREDPKIAKFCIEIRTTFLNQNRWENMLKKSAEEVVMTH